jgi:hypothetical protein
MQTGGIFVLHHFSWLAGDKIQLENTHTCSVRWFNLTRPVAWVHSMYRMHPGALYHNILSLYIYIFSALGAMVNHKAVKIKVLHTRTVKTTSNVTA